MGVHDYKVFIVKLAILEHLTNNPMNTFENSLKGIQITPFEKSSKRIKITPFEKPLIINP
jgi:hypothetical protein